MARNAAVGRGWVPCRPFVAEIIETARQVPAARLNCVAEMLSRWPVVMSVVIDETERDDSGVLTDTACERVFALARAEYFGRCETFAESDVLLVGTTIVADAPVATDSITVSVGVVEIYPDRFTMELRIRPCEGEGIVAAGRCSLSLPAVTDEIRDEFIRLAQDAHYMN